MAAGCSPCMIKVDAIIRDEGFEEVKDPLEEIQAARTGEHSDKVLWEENQTE